MDFSGEQENLVPYCKNRPDKNLSESDLCSKRLSMIPEEETEGEDLHIVGIKVKVDGDKAYSFAVENTRSRSVDTFTPLESSKRLKMGSHDNKSKEFELHIKSKMDNKDFMLEDESPSSRRECNDAVNQFLGSEETHQFSDTSHCIKSIQKTPRVPLKYIIELSSTTTQTEKEIQSSPAQTMSVEVHNPRSMQEAKIQTDRTCDASTSTDHKEVQSVELETEGIPSKDISLQTDTEKATGSSQTETAAIFSIDRVYAASTQTNELENVSTSTDFNIYVVDREKISEKAIDTEDLPYSPLMVALEERVEADGEQTHAKCCHCSCNHPKQHECICKSCHDKQCKTMRPNNIFQSNCHPSTSCDSSNFDRCSENISSEKNKCNTKLRSCGHEQNCCQYRDLTPSGCSKADQETVKKLEPLDTFKVSEIEHSSLALREKIDYESKIEIVKSLASELNKMKTIVAIREQMFPKVERAAALKIPVVLEHFLNSFSVSAYCSPRVVINPVAISIAVSQSPVAESLIGKELKPHARLSPSKRLKEKSQIYLLISDGMKERSVVVSCLPPMMAADDKHSQVCLCRSCYTNVQNILEEKRNRFLQVGSEADSRKHEDRPTGVTKDPPRSTSPKIKGKKFDYTATEAWKPYEHKQDDVVSRKVEATNIVRVGESDSDESTESMDGMDLNSACETVNDHLLSLRTVDKDMVRKAAEMLHKAWFETVASKRSEIQEVRYYMRYFEEFSDNLLRTLLHSVDNNGNNVFHFAFANNRFDLVEELLRNRFATELLKKTNKSGNSPLMICAISLPEAKSDWSAIRSCYELGDVDSKSLKSGQTPLMNAASCGFNEMVDMLLDVGANPNLQDKDGSTALMYAAEHGHEKCIKAIVRHKKCDPTIQDKDGQTACSIALSNGYKNIAVLIHMQALEKRQTSKHSHSPRRYVWTNNESRGKALYVRPRSPSIYSPEVQ